MADRTLEQELEARVDALGFEFVELERAGSKSRPILRLRIDRPDSSPGHGVTVDDCARVSRALETYLEETEAISSRYVLEVSSPGVERPLVRPRDFERFVGRRILLRGYAPLAERERRLEGELLALERSGEPDGERIRLRLDDGAEVEVPRSQVARAQLVFRWNEG